MPSPTTLATATATFAAIISAAFAEADATKINVSQIQPNVSTSNIISPSALEDEESVLPVLKPSKSVFTSPDPIASHAPEYVSPAKNTDSSFRLFPFLPNAAAHSESVSPAPPKSDKEKLDTKPKRRALSPISSDHSSEVGKPESPLDGQSVFRKFVAMFNTSETSSYYYDSDDETTKFTTRLKPPAHSEDREFMSPQSSPSDRLPGEIFFLD